MTAQINETHQKGSLYVVATPIGNLDDVSQRMRQTLSSVSKIAAEDTRRAKRLLSHIGVNTPCFSVHEHNERQKLNYIVQLLKGGESVALVSDAGTPLISDPGYLLVNEVIKQGFPVIPVPGPCAFVAALSVAGLPSDRFIFEGFLPSKVAERTRRLIELKEEVATMIFYESPHRIKESLVDMSLSFGGSRLAVIARELTKTFETVLRGPLSALITQLNDDDNQSKGEFVVMIHGAEKKKAALSQNAKRLAVLLAQHLPGKQAAKVTAQMYGEKKNKIYRFLLGESQ